VNADTSNIRGHENDKIDKMGLNCPSRNIFKVVFNSLYFNGNYFLTGPREGDINVIQKLLIS